MVLVPDILGQILADEGLLLAFRELRPVDEILGCLEVRSAHGTASRRLASSGLGL